MVRCVGNHEESELSVMSSAVPLVGNAACEAARSLPMRRIAELCPPLQRPGGRGTPSGPSCGPDCHLHIGATAPTLLLLLMLQSSRPLDFSICVVEVCFYSHKWSLGKGFVVFDTSLQWKA